MTPPTRWTPPWRRAARACGCSGCPPRSWRPRRCCRPWWSPCRVRWRCSATPCTTRSTPCRWCRSRSRSSPGRRPPTRRYTYGYGRAEDLAGVVIVMLIAVSAAATTWVAASRLTHPHPVSGLGAVAVAAVVGFAGNELVARYRVNAGRRIGSAALVADGLHARTDGFTSLAVLARRRRVRARLAVGRPGRRPADHAGDPRGAPAGGRRGRPASWTAWTRPCSIPPRQLAGTPGVLDVGPLRLRWVGRTLRAECDILVDPRSSVIEAHDVAVAAEHALSHAIPTAGAGARRPAARRRHRLPRRPGFTSPSLTVAGYQTVARRMVAWPPASSRTVSAAMTPVTPRAVRPA